MIVSNRERVRIAHEIRTNSENAQGIQVSCGLARLLGVRGNGPCKYRSCMECRQVVMERLACLIEPQDVTRKEWC